MVELQIQDGLDRVADTDRVALQILQDTLNGVAADTGCIRWSSCE